MLVCYKCKNFQIRYTDPVHKYGCRALGFKSPDTNWYWLVLPCPCYEENPKRKKNIEEREKKLSQSKENIKPSNDSSDGKSKLNIII